MTHNTPLQKQLLILQIKNQDEASLNRIFSVYNNYQTIQIAAGITGEEIREINTKNKLYNQYQQKLLHKQPVMTIINQIKNITNIDNRIIHEALTILAETISEETSHANAYTKNSIGILSYECE